MSQPTPPPAEPPPAAGPVPYGPPAGASEPVPAAAATIDLSGKGVAGTAGKWALRLLLPILIRAVFRALARR